MALISVGIHENLVLSDKTKINEHGTLELAIKAEEGDEAVFAALQNNTVVQSMESSFRFYPPNLLTYETKEPRTAAEIAKGLSILRHQFMEYAKLYGTKEEAEAAIGGLKMFEGLGIPQEDLPKAFRALTNEEFLKKVTNNLSKKFYNYLKAKNAFDGSVKFRQKFLRQSKAKNFATISKSTFDTWIEPMSIPKEQSKIAYSEYEITNGKNNPDPASASASQSEAAEVKAASLFGDEAKPSEGQPSIFS